ncbi:hypothetical protein GCM10007315_18720 [Gemmobacter tilapiae]|uniref:Uncharacterized protein n=1 Tax=Neogemmobacter tilapiae TaxID=875041 RepID=A0A918TPZ3_9RHOB|nr:hypothetical protein GCM10007315_18720 [Gemmobacter tilapiae]
MAGEQDKARSGKDGAKPSDAGDVGGAFFQKDGAFPLHMRGPAAQDFAAKGWDLPEAGGGWAHGRVKRKMAGATMQMIAGKDILQMLAFIFGDGGAQDGEVKAAVKPSLKRGGATAVQAADKDDAIGPPWGGGAFDKGQKAIGG